MTNPEPQAPVASPPSWRCFHCDEVFTDEAAAKEHFGMQEDGIADDVACQLTKDEKGLVGLLREAWDELRKYHAEEDANYRQFHALGAEHSTALSKVEEAGYEKGLADGRATPPPSTVPTVEEIAQVIEHAMHGIEWTAGKRPSIAELEKMLAADITPRITLLPDGSITASEPRDEATKAAQQVHALWSRPSEPVQVTQPGGGMTELAFAHATNKRLQDCLVGERCVAASFCLASVSPTSAVIACKHCGEFDIDTAKIEHLKTCKIYEHRGTQRRDGEEGV